MQVNLCQSVLRDSVCRGLDRYRHQGTRESHTWANLRCRRHRIRCPFASVARPARAAGKDVSFLGWRLLGAAAALDNVWLRCSG